MPLLEGKTALVMGVANRWSIAWAVAQAAVREGAQLILTYQGERQRKNGRGPGDESESVKNPPL